MESLKEFSAFDCPYHVSARSNNRDWFALPMDQVWEIMSNYLHFVRFAYDLRIISFVLMNNHFHLIVSSPQGNLSAAMNYFMRETSRQIGRDSNRINHVYGARHHPTAIYSERYFLQAYKYVYRNPIEAGLSEYVESYKYSTLRSLLGFERSIIPIEEDFTLFHSGLESTLAWLNTSPTPDNKEAVRKALKKQVYQLAKTEFRNKPHPLETEVF